MMRITGVDRTIRAMRAKTAQDARNIQDGITRCTEVILRKAMVYVPKETGALAATGQVHVTGTGFGCRGEVTFGGPDAPYAFAVHEIAQATHAPPTRAYYLRDAVAHTRGTCTAILRRQFAVEKSN